jgi:transposase
MMVKLIAAHDRWAKMSGKTPSIVLCYEAGYDAFWLARFLKARGIECLVVDAASMQVNRRARRVKTDRIDVGMLLRALIKLGQGDRHVWSVVRVPSVDEEDLRRSHRERDRLVRERTAHINRIKGLLFGQGATHLPRRPNPHNRVRGAFRVPSPTGSCTEDMGDNRVPFALSRGCKVHLLQSRLN